METKERHPISADFAEMRGDRFHLLTESMNRRGYDPAEPITLFRGKILDGWNRYRAAMQVGVEPQFTEFNGTIEQAAYYSLDRNTARRQLTKGQEAYALLRMNAQLPEPMRMSDQVIMLRTGASSTTLASARSLAQLKPMVAAAVADGSMGVADAEREAGVKDHYSQEFGTGGIELSARTQKIFNKAREAHPYMPSRKACINQALDMWGKVCAAAQEGKTAEVQIVESGRFGKVVVTASNKSC